MNLVPVEVASQFAGYDKLDLFRHFVWRMDQVLPSELHVVRVNGRYDLDSLEKAITAYSRLPNKQRPRKATAPSEHG